MKKINLIIFSILFTLFVSKCFAGGGESTMAHPGSDQSSLTSSPSPSTTPPLALPPLAPPFPGTLAQELKELQMQSFFGAPIPPEDPRFIAIFQKIPFGINPQNSPEAIAFVLESLRNSEVQNAVWQLQNHPRALLLQALSIHLADSFQTPLTKLLAEIYFAKHRGSSFMSKEAQDVFSWLTENPLYLPTALSNYSVNFFELYILFIKPQQITKYPSAQDTAKTPHLPPATPQTAPSASASTIAAATDDGIPPFDPQAMRRRKHASDSGAKKGGGGGGGKKPRRPGF